MDNNPELNPYQTPAGDIDDTQMTSNGGVSQSTIEVLKKTRPWVLFLGGLGLFVASIVVLGGFGFFVFAALGRGAGAIELVGVVIYAAMGFLYVAPAVYLLRYARGIKRLSSEPTIAVLDEALSAQKSFWKFLGISVGLVFGLYALGAVLMLVAFAFGAAAGFQGA